jgi:hypothetical protein
VSADPSWSGKQGLRSTRCPKIIDGSYSDRPCNGENFSAIVNVECLVRVAIRNR